MKKETFSFITLHSLPPMTSMRTCKTTSNFKNHSILTSNIMIVGKSLMRIQKLFI